MASKVLPPLKITGISSASLPVLVCAKYAGVKVMYAASESGVVVPPFSDPSPVVVEAGPGQLVAGIVPSLRYLARMNQEKQLEGSGEFASGQVDGWIEFAEREMDFPRNFSQDTATDAGKALVQGLCEALERTLEGTTYLVGEAITLADIYVALKLNVVLFDEHKKKFPSLTRWLTTCLNQPNFKSVIAEQGGGKQKSNINEKKGKEDGKKKKKEKGNKEKAEINKDKKPSDPSSNGSASNKKKKTAHKGPVTNPPKIVTKLVGSKALAAPMLIAAKYADFVVDYSEAQAVPAGQFADAESMALALTTPNGQVVYGPVAVLRYLAEANPAASLVGGGSEFREALVDSWVEFGLNELPASCSTQISPAKTAHFRSVFASLEKAVEKSTFLVGHRLTLADIVVAPRVGPVLGQLGGKYPALCRWVNTCLHQPNFQEVLGAPQIVAAGSEKTPKAPSVKSDKKPASGKCTKVSGTEGNVALEKCKELGLSQTTYAHAEAHTVEEQFAAVGHLDGMLTKNLVLKDKKHGTFVVTVEHSRDVHTGVLGKLLELQGKSNLRFASDDILQEKLGVKSGSVSPLCMMNDKNGEIKFAIDKKLVEQEIINCHPLRNDRTTSMKSADILAFVRATGHEPIILDYSKAPPAPKPQEKGKKLPKEKKDKGGKQEKGKKGKDNAGVAGSKKKETLLGISHNKDESFSDWYTQVITYSEMIDYSDISGCYVLRPWSFNIWESIQGFFDAEIKKLGVQNAYFPLFVSKSALETEKDHVEGFAPEVAWVTKSGESDLKEPIAIRPTSETIMYPFYADWIRSHRDLPLLLNQWSNVVRWEFKYPTPFLRSREFLWQEGHTAHATYECAETMVMQILDLYRAVYEDLLAVPVVKGRKTESEKFAGGLITTTVEAFIHGSGRAIQGATSHHLGQNFAKMFNIQFEDEKGQKKMAWQTSWGLTTRTIGVMVMVHGDDKGLVLPPRVAPTQAVVIPIPNNKVPQEKLQPYYEEVAALLKAAGIRSYIDDRTNYRAGWKYNHWEQKGVPVRIEIGPRDMENRSVRICRRDNGEKQDVLFADLAAHLSTLMETIQSDMFDRAKEARDSKIARVTEWKDFVPNLNQGKMVLTPFCNETEWEDKVKDMSRNEALQGEAEDERTSTSVAAKTLCIPFEQPDLASGTPCFVSGKPAECWVLWGRSY